MFRKNAKKNAPKRFYAKKPSKKAYQKRYTKRSIPSLLSNGGAIELRRGYYDATVFVGDDGTLVVDRWDATPSTWLNAGSLQPDLGGNLKQFGLGVNMALDDLVSPGEIRNMFSQYKYGKTQFTVTLESGDSATSIGPGGTAGFQSPGCPHIFYYFDSGNDDAPADMSVVLQRGNMRQHLLSNTNPLVFSHTLRPNFMVDAPQAPAQELFAAVMDKNPWLKCSRPDGQDLNIINHFGTHFYIRNMGGSFSQCRIKFTAIQTLYLRYPL